MKKKIRKSRLLYSMTGNRAVTVRSALSGGTLPSLRRLHLSPPAVVWVRAGVQERALFSEQALVGARREENHGWSAQHLGSGPCSSFCFSAPEDSREEEETEFILSSFRSMGSGVVFSSSSSFALSQRVFQPVVKPRPRMQHCHSLCSSFSGVGVSTPSTWNQIKQFAHKSRSSNKLERRRPVSRTVVVAAGEVPDFLPATWYVKLPPLIPFSARTSL